MKAKCKKIRQLLGVFMLLGVISGSTAFANTEGQYCTVCNSYSSDQQIKGVLTLSEELKNPISDVVVVNNDYKANSEIDSKELYKILNKLAGSTCENEICHVGVDEISCQWFIDSSLRYLYSCSVKLNRKDIWLSESMTKKLYHVLRNVIGDDCPWEEGCHANYVGVRSVKCEAKKGLIYNTDYQCIISGKMGYFGNATNIGLSK